MSYSIIATYWDSNLSMWREDTAYDFTWEEVVLFISFLQEDQYRAIRVENSCGVEVLIFSDIRGNGGTVTIPGLCTIEDLIWN